LELGVYTLHMPRKKVLREVSPKKDLKQRSVSIDTPLKWIELCKELLKLGCPPEDLQRIKGSKWEVVFPTEKQAQEVGGSRWRVGAYTLLPRYLGEKKTPAAPMVTPEELKEKEDRRKRTEAYQDWRMGSLEASIKELSSAIASLIKERVSNEHVSSPGAQPLMLKDTHMHTPTQTTAGGPADTTMRLEGRTEGLGIGRTHESLRNTSSPTLASTGQVNKYPTSTEGTITLGQQPLMPSDTHKHEGTPKDVEMEDTKVTNTMSASKVVQNTTETNKEDEALAAYMAARAGNKAAEKAAQEEAQKVREVEQKAARDAAQKAAIDAAQKAEQDAAQKAAQEAAKIEERKVAQEATRKAEEQRAAQEVAEKKKKDAEELEMRTKIMEEETRQRREWMDKLNRLEEAKRRVTTPTTTITTTTSSNKTSTPTQQQPDYTEDEFGTITYYKGKGDARWHQEGFCARCRRGIRSGEVRFFTKNQQIHTRCGTCPTCKASLAEADVEMKALKVYCECGREVDFFHQC